LRRIGFVSRVLGEQALNRATLARQLLLERAERPALDAVHHLVGLQSQVPHNPYTALWSRLAGFRPGSISDLLTERRVVRTAVMRGTIHLVTGDDCLLLRPLVQPIFTAELRRHRDYSPQLEGVEIEPVLAFAGRLLAQPLTGRQLRDALAERFPDLDPAALAYACRRHLPLVQVPPRGLWGRSAQVTTTTAEAWLGRPLDTDPSLEEVLLRYLGAFGPASVADAGAWSRLSGLRQVFERLRPQLVTFRDQHGRELFDLPDAPLPDPGTPAPVRFLPEYDNVLLSHEDRSRFVSESDRALLGRVWTVGWGAVLHDGRVRGMWRAGPRGLVVRHCPLAKRSLAAIAAEGRRCARFLELDVDVRLEPVSP
jgi:hypothetical protein